jgi:hypothetical protein
MIIYDLKCNKDHKFEGWFPSIESFDMQSEAGLLNCSICGTDKVKRVISGAHSIGLSKSAPKKKRSVQKGKISKEGSKEFLANTDPVVLVKMVQEYVQKNFKDVGEKFPAEVRKMHEGQKEVENICGTASVEERESLIEDEVPFVAVPKLPDTFNN